MPISKVELIDLVALDEDIPGTTRTTSTKSIDLNKALMIKQFLAIETDQKPIHKKKKKEEEAEVIIILDDD